MTTISQIPKPEADKFKTGRKLLLVPLYPLPYHTSTEGEKIIQKYWSQTTAQIGTLQKQLGEINNIYHESIFDKEDQAFNIIKSISSCLKKYLSLLSFSNLSKFKSTFPVISLINPNNLR